MKRTINDILEMFEVETDVIRKIEIAFHLANYLWEMSRKEECYKYLEYVEENSIEQNYDYGLGKAYDCHARINYTENRVDTALEYGFKALKIFRKIQDKKETAIVLNNLGAFYSSIGVAEKAKDYYLKALEYDPGDVFIRSNLYNNLLKNGEGEKAEKYIIGILDDARKANESRILAHGLKIHAFLLNKKGKTEESRKYYFEALELFKNIDFKSSIASIFCGIGETYKEEKKWDKVLDYLKMALEIYEKLQHNEDLIYIYDQLADIYECLNDWKESNSYLRKINEIYKGIPEKAIMDKIAQLEAAYKAEKKEMESREMVEKSARLASIGVMAAGITHEINQPLNAIKISADSILFWDKRNPETLPEIFIRELNKISQGASRIDEIIKHMRSFWIAPNNPADTRENLNIIIENALNLVNRQISSHGIVLTKKLSQSPLFIEGNVVHIEQIIINLITNSIHALDSLENKEKQIEVVTLSHDGYAQMIVNDNGAGLEHTDEIFEPFYSTRPPGEGMGLGLAIVKHYIDSMKGKILAENRDGGGASFNISIPLFK